MSLTTRLPRHPSAAFAVSAGGVVPAAAAAEAIIDDEADGDDDTEVEQELWHTDDEWHQGHGQAGRLMQACNAGQIGRHRREEGHMAQQ